MCQFEVQPSETKCPIVKPLFSSVHVFVVVPAAGALALHPCSRFRHGLVYVPHTPPVSSFAFRVRYDCPPEFGLCSGRRIAPRRTPPLFFFFAGRPEDHRCIFQFFFLCEFSFQVRPHGPINSFIVRASRSPRAGRRAIARVRNVVDRAAVA